MTAKELKEALANVPDDAEVFIDDGKTYSSELCNVEYNQDYNVVYLE